MHFERTMTPVNRMELYHPDLLRTTGTVRRITQVLNQINRH